VKTYEGRDIRNVGVVGHGDSGKTTLTAGLLYTAGATNRLTRVDEGNTITDFDEDEVHRKISITTSLAYAEWKKAKINFLDTPGYNIFINDTRSALIAADARRGPLAGVEHRRVITPAELLTDRQQRLTRELAREIHRQLSRPCHTCRPRAREQFLR